MKQVRLVEIGSGRRFKLHSGSPYYWERDREQDSTTGYAMHAVDDDGKVSDYVIRVPDMPVLIEP